MSLPECGMSNYVSAENWLGYPNCSIKSICLKSGEVPHTCNHSA